MWSRGLRSPVPDTVTYRTDLQGVDWPALKAALAADDFDNGRSPTQLRASFENSHAVALAIAGGEIVGTARALSDGVCNAYIVDVWTRTEHRRQGVATRMMTRLLERLDGQHVYLQVDPGPEATLYEKLGFARQPDGMSRVVRRWLGGS
jgi:predicted GNAT family acetyltransferase